MTWSDGEAFDADDVLFTLEMVMGSEEFTDREASAVRGQVASVEKVDDRTVTMTLNAPNPRFATENFGVRIVTSLLIMPEHVWAGEDPATFAFDPPIGTGPYTFVSAATNRAVWARDDDWWGAATGFRELPEPRRIVFLETGGEESRAQLMAGNELDAAQSVTIGTFEAIQAQNPNVIAWADGYPYAAADPCARQIEFNTTVEPWSDPALRKAVAHIVDREQIVNIAYEGTTTPSSTMFADFGSMEPFIDAVVEAGYALPPKADVEAGQALLEEAGYARGDDGFYAKEGEVLEANIHVNSASTEYTKTIDVVVEQLNRAGIRAKSIPVENGVFWGETLPLGNYEMSYSWLSCGSVNEPWSSMSRYNRRLGRAGRGSRPRVQQHRALGLGRRLELQRDRRRDGCAGTGRPGAAGADRRGLRSPRRRDAVRPARPGGQAPAVQHHLLDGLADGRERLQPPLLLVEQRPPDRARAGAGRVTSEKVRVSGTPVPTRSRSRSPGARTGTTTGAGTVSAKPTTPRDPPSGRGRVPTPSRPVRRRAVPSPRRRRAFLRRCRNQGALPMRIPTAYLANRLVTLVLTVLIAATLIWLIPRLSPVDPAEIMLARMASGGARSPAPTRSSRSSGPASASTTRCGCSTSSTSGTS